MLDHFHVLTMTHKWVPLDQLGKFVIQAADNNTLNVRLREIKSNLGLDELFYLATCNRVFFMLHTSHPVDALFIANFLHEVYPQHPVSDAAQQAKWVQLFSGMEAIEHLYQVAASIDSLVIGERQILGQLRDAFDQAQEWQLSGEAIRLAVNLSVQAAKAVYTQTRISEKPVSVASLAVQKLLEKSMPTDTRILMVGAGQTNELVAKILQKKGFSRVDVFNRTLQKAEKIATLFPEGKAHLLTSLGSYTTGFEVLIVCTAAANPVINRTVYEHLLQGDHRPKVLIDLSLPHDVDESVVNSYPMEYINIEALKSLAKENYAFREQEMEHARNMLARFVAEFPQHYRQRRLELALRDVPQSIKAVKEKTLSEVFRKEIEMLDPDTRHLIERMMGYMEKKCIGIPMKAAREAIL